MSQGIHSAEKDKINKKTKTASPYLFTYLFIFLLNISIY